MFQSLFLRDRTRSRAGKGKHQRDAKPCRFLPRLETLEGRQLLSVAPTDFGSEFIRYNDGELFIHDSAGFRRLDINVTSVSSSFSFRGPPP
jgi:hypothetical protein